APLRVGATSLSEAAKTLGVELRLIPVREPGEVDGAFEAARLAGAGAVLLGGGRVTGNLAYRAQIVAAAARHSLPTMYYNSVFVRDGGLMSYDPNTVAQVRRAAGYVDKILKGTSPAELPIELPRDFEFVINLKTAQALGLIIPPSVLLQATEVIQ